MPRPSPRFSPAVLLIVACGLWGAATVLNKALLASIPPLTLLALQLAPSALLLWLAALATGASMPRRVLLGPLILLGLLNPGVSYSLSLIGLSRVPAGISTLLWAAEPLMILVLAAMILRERVTWRLVAVIALGGLGVLLVADLLGSLGGAVDPLGVLLQLGAVLCCALYTVVARRLSREADPLVTVALQQTAGLAWVLVLLLAGTPFGSVADVATIPLASQSAAAATGLLYYAAAYWLYLTALRWVPAAVAGSYFNIIPVFGVGLAFLCLGETLSPLQWAGAAAILLSAFVLVRLTGRDAAG